MKYFHRVYRLEIGSGTEARIFNGFPDEKQPDKSPAQIRFTIEQTPASGYSYAEITLYGLSDASRRALAQQYRTIRLTAGYVDSYGLLFQGEIENASIGREGPDASVKLYCRSGAKKWGEVRFAKTFGANTPQIEIIQEVAESFGYPVEIIGDFSKLPRAIRGKTIIPSPSHAVLSELARNHKFFWFIENDKVVILKWEGARGTMFRYSATNGLIGSPEVGIKKVKIDTLLNPLIRPWDGFAVESDTARLTSSSVYHKRMPDTLGAGVYKAVSLTHEGDFYGDRWATSIYGAQPEDPQRPS